MRGGPPTVFLVDDEPPVLKAISRVLRAAGFRTAEFDSASLFLERLDADAPGCLVLDLAMPGADGMQVQEALTERGVPLPIIFLTGRADIPTTVRAMKGGAVDLLTKPVDSARLVEAVGIALERDQLARQAHAGSEAIRRRLDTLTPREREVLAHVVAGRLNREIAGELGATEKTIKVHRARVMGKMGAASLADLVRMAERLGIPDR